MFGLQRTLDAFLDALDAHDGQHRHHLFLLHEWMVRICFTEE